MDTERVLPSLPSARLVVAGALLAACSVWAAGRLDEGFKMEPKGAVNARLGYFPVPLILSPDRPAQVRREPVYRTAPKYGMIHLGNGPRNAYVVAVDEPDNADYKIYIDKNQNGDLTDDGDGAWNKKSDKGRVQYGVMDVPLRASYGNARRETSSADYVIGIYRFAGTPSPFMYRQSARTGTVEVGGKTHKAILVENDADGLYNKTVGSAADAKSRPVWMLVDLNDDGKWASGMVDVRAPFKLGGDAYEARVSDDGANVRVAHTDKPVVDLTPKAPPTPPLLKAGSPAPDFVAEKWGGGDLKLSDYKGKVVVLDFWATWCGPCQMAMPHVEAVSKAVRGQDVAVVGVCVWDDKDAYAKWVPDNKNKYTFQFAFDPAGREGQKSIATKLFNVSGIPTTYIIDKNGNIADSIVGYDEGDKRLEEALKKLGVKVG